MKETNVVNKGCAIALCFLSLLISGCELDLSTTEPKPQAIRIVSYNVKNAQSDMPSWQIRKEKVLSFIEQFQPDVFAVQEADEPWVEYFATTLTGFEYVGKGRDDGDSKGESTGIYYKSDKFELVDSGVFWLSDTPSVPSKSWGAAHNRTATFVNLKHRATGKTFSQFNTHLDHASQDAREEGVKLLLEKAKESTFPVVLTGDFNFLERSKLYYEIEDSGFWDSKSLARQRNAFSSLNWFIADFDSGFVIDFVFAQALDFDIDKYQVDTSFTYELEGKRYPVSDHYPVVVDIRLTK